MTMVDQVRQVAADVFGVPLAQISAGTSPETMEAWDSVQHLSLVLALESAFSVQFDPEEIEQMKSIQQIAGLVEGKVGANR